MVRQTASIVVFEILGGLILLAFVLAAVLMLRLASGPIDLAPFRDDVEEALADARGGRGVSLGALQLEWSPQNRRVQITAQDVRLLDGAGRPAAEAQNAVIQLSGSALIFGGIEVLAMDLSDGWIAIDQMSARQWALAGDPLPEFQETQLPDTPQGWIDYVGRVLPEWLRAWREARASMRLEAAGFENIELRVRDQAGALIGTVEDASGRLVLAASGMNLSFRGKGLGEGLPAAITLSIANPNDTRSLRAELALTRWPLGDFGARLGLDSELTEGLPSDISLAANLSEETGIDEITLVARSGEGQFSFDDQVWPVRDLDLSLLYDRSEDRLNLKVASRGAGPFKGTADIALEKALTGEGFRPFVLQSPALTLDLTPVFAAPIDLASVRASGEADMDALALRAAKVEFVSGGARFDAAGDLARTPDRQPGEPPVLGEVTLTVPGPMQVPTVLDFWPVKLGEGARNFTTERIETGTVFDAAGRIMLARDSLPGGHLKDDHLEVTFRVEDARVRFLDDLPAVENAFGQGRLTGNSFRVQLSQGRFAGWTLAEGLVDFPAFTPRGEDFRVFARGRGPARNMMKALVDSRLEIDFDPARMSGDGDLTFEMFRPALNDVPYEDVRFTAIGTVRNAGLKNAALGFDLASGTMDVKVDQAGAELTGAARLGPSPVTFRWYEGFTDEGAPADLTAKGSVSADFLNRFGILGRAYMTGEAPLDVTAKLDGETLIASTISVDLSAARLDMSEIGWVKPAGTAARADVSISQKGDLSTSRVTFISPTARLDGDFTLGADSKLISADLREAFFRNVAEVSGAVQRDPGDRLTVTLRGKYLDISGILPGLGGMAGAAGAEPAEGTPLTITAEVDRLTLREGIDLRQAKLRAVTGTRGLQSLEASGRALGGAPLSAKLSAGGAAPIRIDVTSGDAGFIASAFLGADFITGGEMTLSGTLETANAPADLMLQISNARMSNAPFLTQILSLASLRGLADTLSGEGVMFSRIDIPMKVQGGRYVVTGAKAQGPALGLTANGYIDMTSQAIEIDGVLVPSFGVNSALGGIPIIGDLVVGRDGEGVFSLTYSVRGTLEKANVSVNPLSALAPGVIRRVFENPSDTKIPEATPRPAEQALPQELPPLKEEEF
ncbi:MAG: hypothetical protein C0456_16200 [Hyphomonas sp.]|uniref:YhdP family protein n=1 Tax=Hyphomonas sp. TaxID=87 RepID=UPI001E094542|nr:AsmA-like C-terminal domain-containing protein [Hyphomonas sp.]MBA4228161.1 hypothetical protein [Hyphomonas sp.]